MTTTWKPGELRQVGNQLWVLCPCGTPVRLKRFFGTLHICGLAESTPPPQHAEGSTAVRGTSAATPRG